MRESYLRKSGNDGKERLYQYDLAKIILCFLVIVGHATYNNIQTPFGGIFYGNMMRDAGVADTAFRTYMGKVTNFIYVFHMPAFFAISGILFKRKVKSAALRTLLADKTKRLLLPCIFVWLTWNIPIKYLTGYYENVEFRKIFLQIIFPENVYLWFLEALFFCFFLAFVLEQIPFIPRMVLIGIIYSGGGIACTLCNERLHTFWESYEIYSMV